MKDSEDNEYDNWIYINSSGLSKHNYGVEVIGVDEIWNWYNI